MTGDIDSNFRWDGKDKGEGEGARIHVYTLVMLIEKRT